MFQVILIFQLETNFFPIFLNLFYVLDNFRFIYSRVLILTPFLIVEMKEKTPRVKGTRWSGTVRCCSSRRSEVIEEKSEVDVDVSEHAAQVKVVFERWKAHGGGVSQAAGNCPRSSTSTPQITFLSNTISWNVQTLAAVFLHHSSCLSVIIRPQKHNN